MCACCGTVSLLHLREVSIFMSIRHFNAEWISLLAALTLLTFLETSRILWITASIATISVTGSHDWLLIGQDLMPLKITHCVFCWTKVAWLIEKIWHFYTNIYGYIFVVLTFCDFLELINKMKRHQKLILVPFLFSAIPELF